MSFPMTPLEAVAHSIVDGPFGSNLKTRDYVDEGVPVLQGKNITGNAFQWKDVRFISQEKAKSLKRSEAQVGDHLLIKIGSIGYSAILDDLNGYEKAIIPANLARIRPNKNIIHDRFLHHVLVSDLITRHFKKVASKTAQPALSLKKIKATEIPLPPLEEQKRIAKILDAADALRAKRRESLAQLDALLQSTFLDFFGDPESNPKRWDVADVGRLGEVITGNTPSRQKSEYYGSIVEWIKSDNINTPSCTLTRASEGLSEEGKRVARLAPKGSVLVTCIAGSKSCIGNAAIANREVAFNQQINAFVPGNRIALWYAFGFFLVAKRLVQRASTNSMKGLVSKSAFSKIKMPVPPLELQERFSLFAESLERNKVFQEQHLYASDSLFNSLQRKVFAGEL